MAKASKQLNKKSIKKSIKGSVRTITPDRLQTITKEQAVIVVVDTPLNETSTSAPNVISDSLPKENEKKVSTFSPKVYKCMACADLGMIFDILSNINRYSLVVSRLWFVSKD
jgi:hypothetical protein